MTALTKLEGWDLDVASSEEPRVRDVDVAQRAGLAQPADIRRVIDRNWEELAAHGEIRISAHSAIIRRGPKGREYWLNEDQSVALVAMLRTKVARELRISLVRLFGAYRRGQVAPPTTVALDVVHGPRVGEVPMLKAEVSNMCASVAKATRIPLRRVHGWVRRTFRVPGVHHIGVVIWPTVKALLFEILLGKITIAAQSRGLLPPDRRQLDMWRSN